MIYDCAPSRGRNFLGRKMKESVFCYVPHSRQRQFEELGWEFESYLGLPHACYATLYKWVGEGEPVYPEEDIGVYNKKVDSDGSGSRSF